MARRPANHDDKLSALEKIKRMTAGRVAAADEQSPPPCCRPGCDPGYELYALANGPIARHELCARCKAS